MSRNLWSELCDNQEEKLLTTAELALRLSVAEKTIRDWRYARNLPAIKVGPKLVRYRWRDVCKWLITHGEKL